MNLLRILGALVSGLLVYASFEPLGWGAAAVVGMALFYAVLSPWKGPAKGSAKAQQPSLKFGALLGFLQGFSWFYLMLPWVGEFVGKPPFIALATVLALYGIPLGMAGVWVARQRYGWLMFPFIWITMEYARSHWPFGGFAWVRLAWGQINNPFAFLAQLGGPALVTLAVVLVASSVAHALVNNKSMVPAVLIIALTTLTGIGTGLVAEHRHDGEDVAHARFAAIQGNVPRLGLDFNAQRRAVLANHVRQTQQLDQPVDAIIWPENAADVNPFEDVRAGAMLAGALADAQAPILVGTITHTDEGPRNSMVVVSPDDPGRISSQHDKKYLQPFGEYMPMRDFLRHFSHWVDQAGNFQPGDDNGVVQLAGIPVGVATCYEVIEDAAYRDAVLNGAEILATPTNNATFGFTNMSYQQLAMSRMRAIELDRAVVVAATSGVSAMVHPDGKVSQSSGIFEAATLIEDLPLHKNLTPAARWGFYLELAFVIMGALCLLGSILVSRRSNAASTSPKE